jgi:hypothetical protein
MVLPNKETTPQSPVRMGSQELDQIFQARQNLDDVTELARYATLYKNLGWSPVAWDADTGVRLHVDFQQPQAVWLNLLMDLALKKTRVSLGIRLEPDSRLLVLLVEPAFGKEFLDALGDWRSACSAQAANSWESHFLALPQTWRFSDDPPGADEDAPLSVIGPGGVAPVPPATTPDSLDPWRWVQPPWEQPPRHPAPGLLLLLEETGYISRRSPAAGLPAWEELYPVVCGSHDLQQAVLTPVATRELYYRTIIYEALQAGFRDPRMILGLLWHAPHGETWHGPEAQQRLSQWALEIKRLLAAEGLQVENGFTPAAPPPQPVSAGPPPAPENSWNELQYLAHLASELERQVEELERQQATPEVAPGPATPQKEKGGSPGLSVREQRGELEELRASLEAILSRYQDLLDSK